jgi:hypothetical protein
MKSIFKSMLAAACLSMSVGLVTTAARAVPLPSNFNPVAGAPELMVSTDVHKCNGTHNCFTHSPPPANSSFEIIINGPFKIVYTFLGKEAGYLNKFIAGGLTLSTTDVIGTTITQMIAGGTGSVPFKFIDGVGESITNGGGRSNSHISFAYYLINDTSGYILLNDSARGDADFDDMIIGYQVSAVPLPPALLLFLSGMAGFGLLRKRGLKA